jgi:predicted nucleotide-binding protein
LPRSANTKKESPSRPVIFVGTSKEGLAIGEALQQQLQQHFEVLLWTQDVFQPSQSTLADLLKTRNRVDYAAFVLTADDTRQSPISSRPYLATILFLS